MVFSSFIFLVLLACQAPVGQSKPSKMIGIMMIQGSHNGEEMSSLSCNNQGDELMKALKSIDHNLNQRLDELEAKVNALGESVKPVTEDSLPSTSTTDGPTSGELFGFEWFCIL